VFLHGCHHELTVEKQKQNEKSKEKKMCDYSISINKPLLDGQIMEINAFRRIIND
jgi:hypothetical protein